MGGQVVHRWTIGAGGFLGEATLAEIDALEIGTYQRKGVPIFELTDVYVHPLRRNLGWARALVQTAVKEADTNGWDLFLRAVPYGPLNTRSGERINRMTWEALQAFYSQFGFKARKDDYRTMVRRCTL